jgi:serine acetyltransferase
MFKGVISFPYRIFISGDAVIDDRVIIYQQVTMGSNYNTVSKYKKRQALRQCCIGSGNNVKIEKNCSGGESIKDNLTVVISKPETMGIND